MDRRSFLAYLPGLVALPAVLSACGQSQSPSAQQATSGVALPDDSLRVHPAIGDFDVLNKPAEDWRGVVSEDAYHILFEDGTERRYSSELLKNKACGTYICAACYLPLFPSTTKYESGTGWPSFWAPLEGNLGEQADRSFGMVRTEYHCKRCGGHQGHIFPDGPNPTGLRYCNNGVALRFIPEEEALPDLRS